MQVENDSNADLCIQESDDRIHINDIGVKLLFGIAVTALFACILAFFANLNSTKGLGNGGAIAGMVVAVVIIQLLRMHKIKFALILILWGFALIPIFFGFRTFGFNAPGIVCVPISIMAASWALSVRHAIAMTVCAGIACIVFYFLIEHGIVHPAQPNMLVRLLILLGVLVVALLFGLIGVRALRMEFARVKDLAKNLELKAVALDRSEASFSALFLSNPLPSISGDVDGRLTDVNHAFISDFGYVREQVIHRTIDSLHLF